ncbi:hypothetical protein SAMN05880501_101134 [Ureibacillus xyleni]|uniref:Mannitol repressor n=1 Tax=Ureibacillus xyleni TaxID=614648 RepID=A0A285R865_9BACL|nr:hypothetical protein [Ureibacillus xyleni]SOB90290.1 hypothetical protein SAMN05880501_101134 [Ureibacillus xyleni]
MVLYDFLMEIVSKNKPRKEQKNVSDFIRENGFNVGINHVVFRTTRRENSDFLEDDFTYYRNEIAHAEFQNDFAKYETLSSAVTNVLINKLLEVIHFGIQNLE